METNTEKMDYTALLKTNLPLSQQTYEKLNTALRLGHLQWKDMSNELKLDYNGFDKEERKKAFQKGVDEGKWQDWD